MSSYCTCEMLRCESLYADLRFSNNVLLFVYLFVQSCSSTFPACVSPVPGPTLEGDSSSDEDLARPQPSRKISQVSDWSNSYSDETGGGICLCLQITPNNAAANQDPIRLSLPVKSKASSSQPIGSSYVNVERRQLSQSHSNNFQDLIQSGTESEYL